MTEMLRLLHLLVLLELLKLLKLQELLVLFRWHEGILRTSSHLILGNWHLSLGVGKGFSL